MKTNEDELDYLNKELIPEPLEVILEKLPPEEKKIIKAVIAVSLGKRAWAAPMPPPDILMEYNDSFPGGAEAIYRMAKDQSDHRMNMETTLLRREFNQSAAGQCFAFIIAMSFLLVAGYLIYYGHETEGTIFGTIDVVGLVTVFIIGRKATVGTGTSFQKESSG